MGPLRDSVVGGAGHEPKSPLTPNHQMLDDLNRVVDGEVNQGVQGVTWGLQGDVIKGCQEGGGRGENMGCEYDMVSQRGSALLSRSPHFFPHLWCT